MAPTRRHLISLNDLTDADLEVLIADAVSFSSGQHVPLLAGLCVGLYFRKTSTRTRTSFSVAAGRLGAQVIVLDPKELQEQTGETFEDTMQVVAGMLDALVMRTAGPDAEYRIAAKQSQMAVVNAMSSSEHPTQAISDLGWLTKRFGSLPGLTIAYVGEGNNTAVALALALPRFPDVTLELCTPPGYGLDPAVLRQAQQYAESHGARVRVVASVQELSRHADVVYTTRWQTTGTSKPDPGWRTVFAPFQVDQQLMDRCQNAILMHDLPAHRGQDVTAEVLDGPRSVAFEQAHFKLSAAMSVLSWCLSDRPAHEPGVSSYAMHRAQR
jgi:ornithine carbamoyltransferase